MRSTLICLGHFRFSVKKSIFVIQLYTDKPHKKRWTNGCHVPGCCLATFVGWFDGDSELENAEAAVAGKTYTAKWTKNGKTVRTAVLDLTPYQ